MKQLSSPKPISTHSNNIKEAFSKSINNYTNQKENKCLQKDTQKINIVNKSKDALSSKLVNKALKDSINLTTTTNKTSNILGSSMKDVKKELSETSPQIKNIKSNNSNTIDSPMLKRNDKVKKVNSEKKYNSNSNISTNSSNSSSNLVSTSFSNPRNSNSSKEVITVPSKIGSIGFNSLKPDPNVIAEVNEKSFDDGDVAIFNKDKGLKKQQKIFKIGEKINYVYNFI